MTCILSVGTPVRVRLDWPESRGPVHIRTPHYLRGRHGRILRYLGDFPNPEDIAFNRTPAVLPLYHVQFEAHELWPDGVTADEILVEIYGSWLQPEASKS
jgi:nitrile hydratase